MIDKIFMNFIFQILLVSYSFPLPISKNRMFFAVMLVYKLTNFTQLAARLELGTVLVV